MATGIIIVDPSVKSKKVPLERYKFLLSNEYLALGRETPVKVCLPSLFMGGMMFLQVHTTAQRSNQIVFLGFGSKVHRSRRTIVQCLVEALMIVKL